MNRALIFLAPNGIVNTFEFVRITKNNLHFIVQNIKNYP